jgi:hypothetical protein
MRTWVLAALGAVVILTYAFFYFLSTSGIGNGNSFVLINSVGLAAVIIGIIAAGFILRRATPHT